MGGLCGGMFSRRRLRRRLRLTLKCRLRLRNLWQQEAFWAANMKAAMNASDEFQQAWQAAMQGEKQSFVGKVVGSVGKVWPFPLGNGWWFNVTGAHHSPGEYGAKGRWRAEWRSARDRTRGPRNPGSPGSNFKEVLIERTRLGRGFFSFPESSRR